MIVFSSRKKLKEEGTSIGSESGYWTHHKKKFKELRCNYPGQIRRMRPQSCLSIVLFSQFRNLLQGSRSFGLNFFHDHNRSQCDDFSWLNIDASPPARLTDKAERKLSPAPIGSKGDKTLSVKYSEKSPILKSTSFFSQLNEDGFPSSQVHQSASFLIRRCGTIPKRGNFEVN